MLRHLMKTLLAERPASISAPAKTSPSRNSPPRRAAVGLHRRDPLRYGAPGTARRGKLLDVSRPAQLGWRARISLEEGIGRAYRCVSIRDQAGGGVIRSHRERQRSNKSGSHFGMVRYTQTRESRDSGFDAAHRSE